MASLPARVAMPRRCSDWRTQYPRLANRCSLFRWLTPMPPSNLPLDASTINISYPSPSNQSFLQASNQVFASDAS
jgi:hypothetical protein